MRILFDLYTTQFFVGGGAEYIRKVFYTIKEEITKRGSCDTLIALVDTSVGKFAYKDLAPDCLKASGLQVEDLKGRTLKNIISDAKIDKVFIGVAQYWGYLDLESISCPAVCVIHDLCNEEYEFNKIDEYVRLNNFKGLLRYKFHFLRHKKKHLDKIPKIIKQAQINPDFQLVTVSEYSKSSICYNFDYPKDSIKVLYSPERVNIYRDEIECADLQQLLYSKKRYYLMLNANRIMKNATKAFHAFKRYQEITGNDVYLVTTGCKERMFGRHIIMPYLSDSDLVQLTRNCYALLFPSFFEGFGYPPVEAMSYSKPVLSSNVTSMPEILGDAPIYFSPFYETDIFNALQKLTDDNYNDYSLKSKTRYKEVCAKQKEDLVSLINLILSF